MHANLSLEEFAARETLLFNQGISSKVTFCCKCISNPDLCLTIAKNVNTLRERYQCIENMGSSCMLDHVYAIERHDMEYKRQA